MRVHELGFRPDVQGLRAIAVALVVLYHAGVPGVTGGYIGVDVFLVISGFLISAHILKELVDTGGVRLARFYARRILRILPASIVVLVVSLFVASLVIPPLLLPDVFKDGAFTALYVPNFLFASQQIDYLSNPNPSLFQHYWSLGVEEQFYLVWPAALMLVFFLARRTLTRMVIGLVAVLVVSLVASIACIERSQSSVFFMMPFRIWEFALGALLALVATTTNLELGPKAAALARWAGIATILVCALTYSAETTFPGVAAILPVGATGLIILAGAHHLNAETPRYTNGLILLTAAPMVFLGTISYSVYLVHWPMLVIPQIADGDHNPLPLWVTLTIAGLCLPVAWALYRWVETPIRRLRLPPVKVLSVTAVITALVVVASFTGQHVFETTPLHTPTVAPALVVTTNPTENPEVPINMTPSIRDASTDNPQVYERGCHLNASATTPTPCEFGDNPTAPHVFLFGDSHAAQWTPPLADLAQSGDISLTTHTKSSCSPLLSDPTPACQLWVTRVIEGINDAPPELVLIAGYPGDQAVQVSPELWGTSVREALSRLHPDVTVAVINDTPQFDMSPPACLSKHLDDTHQCGTTPDLALSRSMAAAQEKAVEESGATVIDLTSYFCTDVWCPVVTADTLMYRDAHHVSRQYSRQLRGALWAEVAPLVAQP